MIKIFHFTPLMINLIIILILFMTPSKKINPVNLMFILIVFTSFISLKISLLIYSWSSMILFLIMIGGLMIIFMYITSLANNEISSMNFNHIMPKILSFFLIMMIVIIFTNTPNLTWNPSFLMWSNLMIENFELNFYKMFSNMYFYMTLFIINYLFFSMICIMNICYKIKSPLRQLFF